MASTFRQKQKRHLITAIVCCVLVLAILIATVAVCLVHRASVSEKFADRDFASALASALKLSSRYDLEQSDLDRYESLVYFWSVGVDTNNGYSSYAYPVIMLGDKTYTDALIEQSDPDYKAPEDAKEVDYSSNYTAVTYPLTDPADINLFRNLRVVRALDIAELNEISTNCQTTQIYSMYGLGTTAVSMETVLSVASLSKLTDLSQLSELTKLEQLSLCYSGIKTLDGIENFKNLKKLDVSNTALTDVSALSKVTSLTYLGLNSINVTPKADDESESTESTDNSSSDTSDDSSEETSSEEEKELTFNESGLTAAAMEAIAANTGLTYLDISNNNVSDLSALSSLTSLHYLSVAANPLTDLRGAENMKDLKVLYANDSNLESISAVNGFTKLETLYVSGTKLTNLDAVKDSVGMTYIDASGSKLESADAVSGMKDLTVLILSNCKLTKAPDLSALTKVTSVNLSGNKELSDVSGLEKFNPTDYEKADDPDSNISVTLNLQGCAVKTISLSATMLTNLNLQGNQLGKDVEGAALSLKGCNKLTTLNVSENKDLTTLAGIENLSALATLTANETAIAELPDMSNLKKLTSVNLSKSALTDINGLKDNESITTLTMTECEKLTDISCLYSLKALSSANFNKCTALTNDSLKAAFGTPKSEANPNGFAEDSKLSLTLTGCTGLTDFDCLKPYTDMKITRDNSTKE